MSVLRNLFFPMLQLIVSALVLIPSAESFGQARSPDTATISCPDKLGSQIIITFDPEARSMTMADENSTFEAKQGQTEVVLVSRDGSRQRFRTTPQEFTIVASGFSWKFLLLDQKDGDVSGSVVFRPNDRATYFIGVSVSNYLRGITQKMECEMKIGR
ncbi:hypothetical protein [Bradyrhizobium aeschynomenes]|uniref:hypothetical protein n=1 Tax=Bradyrhizobium aeschynomenes TaxID=2734909 RepID=UPI001552A400|nr:hypothetical protein [Bradyrhizobium aeschynomenes]NPV19948.1 hypothetical protein [Bradyrhizobium aeschynomenes]